MCDYLGLKGTPVKERWLKWSERKSIREYNFLSQAQHRQWHMMIIVDLCIRVGQQTKEFVGFQIILSHILVIQNNNHT